MRSLFEAAIEIGVSVGMKGRQLRDPSLINLCFPKQVAGRGVVDHVSGIGVLLVDSENLSSPILHFTIGSFDRLPASVQEAADSEQDRTQEPKTPGISYWKHRRIDGMRGFGRAPRGNRWFETWRCCFQNTFAGSCSG